MKTGVPSDNDFNQELDSLQKEAQVLRGQWETLLEDLTAVNLFFNGVVNEFSALIDGIFSLWDDMEGAFEMPGMGNLKQMLKDQIGGFRKGMPEAQDFEQHKKNEEEKKIEIEQLEQDFFKTLFAHSTDREYQLILHREYNAGLRDKIAKLKIEGTENKAFLSRISNELMNPINSFMGFSDSMSLFQMPGDHPAVIGDIASSARNFAALLNDYALFNEIREKKITLRKADYNFQDELIEIIEKYSIRAQDQGFELFYNIDPDIPTNIIDDKAKMNQFISLLIENTMQLVSLTNSINKATGGKINLELRPVSGENKKFRISVLDPSYSFRKDDIKEVHQYYSYYHDQAPYAGLKLKIVGGMALIMGSRLQLTNTTEGNVFYTDIEYESL